jgi:hypothetical protein
MNLEDKIQFIIDTDGSEGSDGYNGLQTFMKYCLPEEEYEEFSRVINPIVNDFYESILEELEEEEVITKFMTFNMMRNLTIFTCDGQDVIKIGDKAYDMNGNLVAYKKDILYNTYQQSV